MIKAIRGAITVEENTAEAIAEATRLLLAEIMALNQLSASALIQVIFSATRDLDAAYPAKFARALGWQDVPLFCVQEMHVPGSLLMCLRVMITVETDREQVKHVYLRGAKALRPDLADAACQKPQAGVQ